MSARTLVEVGGLLFLALDDGVHGEELWVSDGTDSGTTLVRDIRPGGSGSEIDYAAEAAGGLFFVADDGVHGAELWRSDGTQEGTFLVRDIFPGSVSSDPRELTGLGQLLIFTANDGSTGIEPWRSDGSEAGTFPVGDIAPSFASSFPEELTRLGAEVFFRAHDHERGLELWKTDGTEAGTSLVSDIALGSASSAPAWLEAVGSVLFFTAYTEALGSELWKTDGAAGGTVPVKDIAAGSSSSWARDLTGVGAELFFVVPSPGGSSFELWKSDGTETGTVMVSTIDAYLFEILEVTATADHFYLLLYDGYDETRVWSSDGTSVGTLELATLHVDPYGLPVMSFWPTPIGGDLYFSGDDGVVGEELWKTDGSVAGTRVVVDLVPGALGSMPRNLGSLNGEVVFIADDLFHGPELWRSDGTDAGTRLIRDVVERSADSLAAYFFPDDGEVFFAATDGLHGYELWRTDGTESGTGLVAERIAGPEPIPVVYPRLPFIFPVWDVKRIDGSLLAAAGGELWRIDGSGATEQIPIPGSFPEVRSLIVLDGVAYFVIRDDELWRSDGTLAGTFKIREFACRVENLIAVGDHLFFSSCQPDYVWRLWRTDGTASGSEAILEGFARYPVERDGELLFSTTDFGGPHRLWQTTGGGATAVLLAELPKAITALAVAGPTIYLVLDQTDLWQSDATQAGTHVLRSGLLEIRQLTAAGHRLFFTADDSVFGVELWRSDGSVAGTSMVADIYPGPSGSDPNELTSFDGSLFFTADDGLSGQELYASDGTGAGTTRVADLWPGEPGSRPHFLTASAGVLYLSADDGYWGRELWRVTTPPTLRAADLALLEGDDGLTDATMPVTLSHVSNLETRVSFKTLGQTATADVDYVSDSGTLAIPPGTLAASIRVGVVGDREIEQDEQLLVILSSAIGAALEGSEYRVTLVNDDFAEGGCGFPDAIELHLVEIEDLRVFSACSMLTAYDMAVAAGGILELTAGIQVALGDGFAVEGGGRLTVTIDASLAD